MKEEKKWNDLEPAIQNIITEKVKRIDEYGCAQVNSHATILSNWLYALSTGSLGAVITLVATGRIRVAILKVSAIFFFISLCLCVFSTGVEWLRFSIASMRVRCNFNKLIASKLEYDVFCSSLKEHWGWLFLVTILKLLGYGFLLIGIYHLISIRKLI